MPAYVDPKRVSYPPESLLESQSTDPAVGGTVVASYHDWPPYYVEMERLVVEQGAQDLDFVVSADGYARKMSGHATALPLDTVSGNHAEPTRVTARDTLELMVLPTTGVADSDINVRWNMTARYPTVADKLRLERVTKSEVAMNAAEQALVEKYNMKKLLDMGMLPRNEDLLGDNVFKWFDEIQVVSRRVPDIDDGDEWIVGGELKVPQRKVFTLLGIAFDPTAAATVDQGGITFNELWIKIDRDAVNDYMVLDAMTLPTDGTAGDNVYSNRLFMPTLEKMSVRLDNQSGSNILATDELTMRFIYGVRAINICDHMYWNYEFISTAEEEAADAIDEEYMLREKLAAGLIDPLQPSQIMNLKLP